VSVELNIVFLVIAYISHEARFASSYL